MAIDVIDAAGVRSPYNEARVTGALVLLGVPAEDAIRQARVLTVILEALQVREMTAATLRHVIEGVARAASDNVARIVRGRRRSPP